MKIFRNTSEIKKKEKLGRRITLIGLAVLFIGLLASFTPSWFPPDSPAPNALIRFVQLYWVYISFGALALGFLASNVGSYYINRFAPRRWPGSNKIARPDELLAQGLKGFDDKYALFLWSLPQSSYLLAGPSGILAFTLKGDKGKVSVSGDRWREKFSLGRILTGITREGVGNPGRELEQIKQSIRELLQKAAESGDISVDVNDFPIDGAVVFINPQAELDLDNPTVPVMPVSNVKKFVRNRARAVKVSGPQLREVMHYLEQQAVYDKQ
jgi:hypothetical protein